MPQSLHVDLIFLRQECVLPKGSRVKSFPCWKVELKEDVKEDGNLMVVRTTRFNNSFVESSEIAIGFRRVILCSWNVKLVKEYTHG